MHRVQAFHRRTRRGKVQKLVREHYLRDDIASGVPGTEPRAPDGVALLSDEPYGARYVVLDTNVVLHQMDLLEQDVDALRDVVVPQTVMAEVRHRDVSLYKRLQALVRDSTRRFFVFANEHNRATYVDRARGESPNDYNDRAIRVTAKWYQDHLRGRLRVLLLSDDSENRKRAAGEGIEASSAVELARSLQGEHPGLVDLVARPTPATQATKGTRGKQGTAPAAGTAGERAPLFRKYLSEAEVARRLRERTAFQVRPPPRPPRHSLPPRRLPRPSFPPRPAGLPSRQPLLVGGGHRVSPRAACERQAVRGRPASGRRRARERAGGRQPRAGRGHCRHRAAAPRRVGRQLPWPRQQRGGGEGEGDGGGGGCGGQWAPRSHSGRGTRTRPAPRPRTASFPPPLLASQTHLGESAEAQAREQPRGRVVGVIRRNWRQLCGSIRSETPTPAGVAVFVPVNRRVPKVRIHTRQKEALAGKRIVVAVDSWDVHSAHPDGHFVRTIGDVGDRETETEVILLEHDIPAGPFPRSVLACLPPQDWAITPENSAGRVDLRDRCVCSIDPPGCKVRGAGPACSPTPPSTVGLDLFLLTVAVAARVATGH